MSIQILCKRVEACGAVGFVVTIISIIKKCHEVENVIQTLPRREQPFAGMLTEAVTMEK